MAINGVETALYLQKDLISEINDVLLVHSDLYKSRNHLINAAIVREIRRLKEIDNKSNTKG